MISEIVVAFFTLPIIDYKILSEIGLIVQKLHEILLNRGGWGELSGKESWHIPLYEKVCGLGNN